MTKRRRRTFGISFSWRRASGLSAAKARLSCALGVPLTRSGRQRKAGRKMGCAVVLAVLTSSAAGAAEIARLLIK